MYTFDRSNDRLLAYDKRSGDFIAQYRLKGGDGWADLRAMYVIPGVEDSPTRLVWLSKDAVNQAVLQAGAGGRRRLASQPVRLGQRLAIDRAQSLARRRPGDPAPRRQSDPADAGHHALRSSWRARSSSRYQVLLMIQGGDAALTDFITRWGVVPAELVAAFRCRVLVSPDASR